MCEEYNYGVEPSCIGRMGSLAVSACHPSDLSQTFNQLAAAATHFQGNLVLFSK